MKDKRIITVNNSIELDVLDQVLNDRGIPHRFDVLENRFYPPQALSVNPQQWAYAWVWGYVDDEQDIIQALAEVRAATVEPIGDYRSYGRMWRIKQWRRQK